MVSSILASSLSTYQNRNISANVLSANNEMEFDSPKDTLLHSLIFKHENKLGEKLMEKPSSYDPQKYLVGSESKYFLVEDHRFSHRPHPVWGLVQGNRLGIIREASMREGLRGGWSGGRIRSF